MAIIKGTSGADSLTGTAGDDEISGLGGNDTLVGGGAADSLLGGGGQDWLRGDAGTDLLDGGAGADVMEGGAHNDTYIVNDVNDTAYETSDGGIDTVFASVTNYILSTNVEHLRLDGTADLDGRGNSLNNQMTGNDGDNYLAGYEGLDTLIGGKGDDTLGGGDQSDVLDGGPGDDWLPADSGADTIFGRAGDDGLDGYLGNDSLDGGAGHDNLGGGEGHDTLVGGAGKDTLDGGNGDDLYVITDLNDFVIDAGGNDTATVSVSGVKLPDSIENVLYSDGAKPLVYYIDALYSGYRWGLFGEPIAMTFGFLSEPGPSADANGATDFRSMNELEKDLARAAIESWAAVSGITFTEILTPVTADDISSVDLCLGMSDQPFSSGFASYPPGGEIYIDYGYSYTPALLKTMIHEVGHALGLKHPHEAPQLPDAEDNQLHTVMSYDSGNNIFFDGNDWHDLFPEGPMLYDVAAIQYLYGVNTATGSGNDVYTFGVDDPFFRTLWDAGGTDTISVSNFTEGCAIDLRDGHFSNITVPSHPGGSSDGLYDSVGNLSISYGAVIEKAIGGTGADLLIGNEVANRLDGRAGNDTLSGSAGNDLLIGRDGNDRLTGGTGADRFLLDTALNVAANVDRITDFNPAADTIQLDNDIFIGLALGTLAPGIFYGAPAAAAASDADDRIIYDTTAGKLYYDADGSGAGSSAVLFATLTGAPGLADTAFLVVA